MRARQNSKRASKAEERRRRRANRTEIGRTTVNTERRRARSELTEEQLTAVRTSDAERRRRSRAYINERLAGVRQSDVGIARLPKNWSLPHIIGEMDQVCSGCGNYTFLTKTSLFETSPIICDATWGCNNASLSKLSVILAAILPGRRAAKR